MAVVELGDRGRRTRVRKSLKVDKQEIVDRVLDFYNKDLEDRQGDRDVRLQRYAKFRMWTEGKDWPWEDSSDAAIPDMMEKSLRVQDTLHNAVMQNRPPIGAKAFHKTNKDKEKTVDNLIDYQMFVEQGGETAVGELADAFVNDGVFTAFIPWVKEARETVAVKIFPPIPEEVDAPEYFLSQLRREFPELNPVSLGDGWDWQLEGEKSFKAQFYTKDDEVEMVVKRDVTVYDGPKLIVKEYDHVLYPSRAANLQMPSPSNPGGAAHVILLSFPTVGEIKRLAKDGFYDLIGKEDLDSLENVSLDTSDRDSDQQKDDLSGTIDSLPKAKSHRVLTMIMCFDVFDADKDGIDEDMIWWVIKETKTLVKARALTEMHPSNPPRRPFGEASFIPVKGRRAGISLLEMIEGLHDTMKQFFDQTADSVTIRNVPFGFYRPSSGLKNEIIRYSPGDMYPLQNPTQDVHFPNMGGDNQGAGMNMMTIISTMEDRLTTQSALQSGAVPPGSSTALRTTGNMNLLAGLAEARPERILRRFFMGLTEIWHQFHELNQHFLPKDKQIRIAGMKRPSEDPYLTIGDASEIDGRFQFDFSANILNTSKATLQQSLGQAMGALISPLAFQMGVMRAPGAYRLFRDFMRALGLDPDNYLSEPEPGSDRPLIMAEEAISAILRNQIPDGNPAEGAQEHLAKLMQFIQTGSIDGKPDDFDRLGLLTPDQADALKAWLVQIQERAGLEAQQQQLQESAQGFGNGQPGRPAEGADVGGTQMISGENELIDETLPG